MTGKIALIVAFVGMASATGKPEERRNYKPKEIETGKEYPLAPLSELISIKRPETIVLAKVEITEKQRQDFEKKFRETAPRFDVAIVALPQVMDFPSTPYINQHGKDRPYFALYFDKNTSDKTSIYYTGNGLPSRGEKIDTADVFEAYARDCYLKAFDSTPIGELESAGNGGNLKVSHGESAFWKVLIEGVSMKKTSSVRIALEGNEQWSLSCNKGPTAEEVKALTEHLRSQPTRVTDQEAVATAWKNWKAVRPANYSDDVDFITCELREVSPDEIKPWNGSGPFTEQLELTNKNPKPGPFDPAFYEVKIMKNLFEAKVFIDRQSGQVICIKQRVMQW